MCSCSLKSGHYNPYVWNVVRRVIAGPIQERKESKSQELTNVAPQYIFTMENVRKFYDKKEILKGIWLSFYPGAKIGVLGGNGAGKSTLLRIMAGVDKDFLDTDRPSPGVSVGYLPPEP